MTNLDSNKNSSSSSSPNSKSNTNSNTNSASTFPKPNAFLYRFLNFFVRIYLWAKFKPEYKFDEIRKIKGPAIVLCSHTSNLDFLLVAVGLLPIRPTYIMSNHFFVHPKIGKLLRPLHAIPKKMFCADINAVRQIMKAVKSGNVVVMFPEGRLTCCGHTLSIADGTAELVKKLGVDVYYLVENGLYKALPKWSKAGIRKGPVSLEGGLLMKGDEIASLNVSEIEDKIARAIEHDDEKAFVGKEYKCDKPALGLERILYKCPVCGEEFAITSSARTLDCSSCGASWTLDNKYVLDGPRFDSINSWFDWEQSEVDLDAGLECDCLLGTADETGVMNPNAGKGHISINKEEICFSGECFGKELAFTEKTSIVKAFPIAVGEHIDIYSNKILYYIYPQPNKNMTVKCVQYLDKLSAER